MTDKTPNEITVAGYIIVHPKRSEVRYETLSFKESEAWSRLVKRVQLTREEAEADGYEARKAILVVDRTKTVEAS